jgi:parvulin-like peptidyl-prolyl isomerase
MFRWIVLSSAACVAACASADAPATRGALEQQGDKVVLARVGDDAFTLKDVLDAIAQRGAFAQERYQAPQARAAFLESFVDFEVMVREAFAQGLHRSEQVARALKSALAAALWERAELHGAERSKLDEARLRAYFDSHRDELREPDSVRASHLLVRLPDGQPLHARKEARDRARAILSELGASASAETFAAAARKYSQDDATRARGGTIHVVAGQGEEGDVPAEVAEAAFRAKPGNVELVESPLGVHLLRVESLQRGGLASFRSVRKRVEARVWQQLRRDALRALLEARRRSANVVIDDTVMRTLALPVRTVDGGR